MLEGKKLICPINGSNKFIKLLRIKKFPIYMGVVEKKPYSRIHEYGF